MKTCRVCTQAKPLDAYRGTRSACRECENARLLSALESLCVADGKTPGYLIDEIAEAARVLEREVLR